MNKCKYCEEEYFVNLNDDTLAYSDIEISLSKHGMLRVRTYLTNSLLDVANQQEIININYCPMCGRKLGDK